METATLQVILTHQSVNMPRKGLAFFFSSSFFNRFCSKDTFYLLFSPPQKSPCGTQQVKTKIMAQALLLADFPS